VNFPAFSGDQLDQRISNEAESNTVGDAVGQGHDDHGQESGEGLGEVVEINFHHGADHENPDDYQGRSGGFGRNQTGQGGDEESKQEEHARYNGGQAGASPFGDAGGAFNVCGHRAGSQQRPAHGADGVHRHGLAYLGQPPLFIQEAGTRPGADEGAHGIKDVDKEEGKDHKEGDG